MSSEFLNTFHGEMFAHAFLMNCVSRHFVQGRTDVNFYSRGFVVSHILYPLRGSFVWLSS